MLVVPLARLPADCRLHVDWQRVRPTLIFDDRPLRSPSLLSSDGHYHQVCIRAAIVSGQELVQYLLQVLLVIQLDVVEGEQLVQQLKQYVLYRTRRQSPTAGQQLVQALIRHGVAAE